MFTKETILTSCEVLTLSINRHMKQGIIALIIIALLFGLSSFEFILAAGLMVVVELGLAYREFIYFKKWKQSHDKKDT
jgi:hypothetical protein